MMKTRIVQIGNSRGIRIPKQLLEQTGLNGEVEIHATKKGLVITRLAKPRAGWAEDARKLAATDEDQLLDEGGPADEVRHGAMGMVANRFEIYLVRLDPTEGAEIKKTRP
jgi:antitoxin MazE